MPVLDTGTSTGSTVEHVNAGEAWKTHSEFGINFRIRPDGAAFTNPSKVAIPLSSWCRMADEKGVYGD